MPNPSVDSFSIGDGKIVLRSGLTNFSFPYTGPVPVMPADLATLQSHADEQLAAAAKMFVSVLASGGFVSGGNSSTGGGTSGTAVPDTNSGSGQSSTGTAVDPTAAMNAKYFPSDAGNAAFPSPENSRMIRNADGTISGKPYLLDVNGTMHQLVPSNDKFPNGYAVNGNRTGGGGSDELYSLLMIRQGHAYAQRASGQWQYFNPSMASMYNAGGLPDAFQTDATGATTSTVSVSSVKLATLPASRLGLLDKGNRLTVGQGKQYATITAAVSAMNDGDTVAIDAGTYKETPPALNKVHHLLAVGGQALIDCTGLTGSLAYGKGALVPVADGIIEGIRVTGVAMDQVGAQLTSGVRPDVGCNYLVLKNVELDNNQSGLGTGGNLLCEITIDGGHFHRNGLNSGVDGNGFTHNIYTGEQTQLIIKGGFVSDDPNGGHAVKHRGPKFTCDDATITSGGDAAAIDLPQGTVVGTINNTAITKVAGNNHSVINYGTDSLTSGNGGLQITGGSLAMLCDNPFFNVNVGSVITIDKSVKVSGNKATVTGGKVVGI